MPAGSTAVNAVWSSLNHFSDIGAAAPKVTPLLPRSTPVERPIVSVDLPPTTAATTAATTTTGAAATHQLEDSVSPTPRPRKKPCRWRVRSTSSSAAAMSWAGARSGPSASHARKDAVEIGIVVMLDAPPGSAAAHRRRWPLASPGARRGVAT